MIPFFTILVFFSILRDLNALSNNGFTVILLAKFENESVKCLHESMILIQSVLFEYISQMILQ